jgi:hypothetical protein
MGQLDTSCNIYIYISKQKETSGSLQSLEKAKEEENTQS